MAYNDPLVTPTGQQLPPMTTVFPETTVMRPQPKEPNKFLKVLGGVASGADPYAKVRAGASLVQFYSALVFQGPEMVERLKRELTACLRSDGGALNLVAPGVGSLLGNVSGGGGSSFSSYGALMEQQRQFEEMQRYNQISTALQQKQQNSMMNQQQQQSMQLLGVQHRVSMQSQEFTTVSNLMKTRHDSEMSAVNNIKS